jgi:hypothetical protein
MQLNQYLANRTEEVLLNGKWIANTNFKEQIESVSWREATTKIDELNTIALLTFHVDYYLGGLNQVFDGGTLDIKDKFSFDMPAITSDEDWQELKKQFIINAEKFVNHINNMTEEKINSDFIDSRYGTYLRNIDGMLEHTYYHLGQISLIKKMIIKKN